MPIPAPNDRLAGLVRAVGEDDARELVTLYLETFVTLVAELEGGDASRSERAAHSLKSSSQQMGLSALARRLAQIEERLGREKQKATPAEVQSVKAEFAASEGPLKAFARG